MCNLKNLCTFMNWKLHLFHAVTHGTCSTFYVFSFYMPNGIYYSLVFPEPMLMPVLFNLFINDLENGTEWTSETLQMTPNQPFSNGWCSKRVRLLFRETFRGWINELAGISGSLGKTDVKSVLIWDIKTLCNRTVEGLTW